MKRFKVILIAAALAAAALLPAAGILAQADLEGDAEAAYGVLMKELEQKKTAMQMEELISLAERSLKEFLEKFPGTKAAGNARATLGQIYLSLDRLDEAEAELRKVAEEGSGAEEKTQGYARMMLEKMSVIKRLAIGAAAIDFTAVDTEGKKVTLGQYKGKVLLLDFWASWCSPCRAEMPNVKKVYDQYHSKGFEILGISFDESKEKFEAYVKDQGMKWRQIFDGKGWQAEMGQKYAISSIPATFLLDREGIIRHKNLRGNELEAAVKELTGKK